MFLYKKLKLNLEREFYLSYINSDIRRGFTKIRIRDHNLEIEKGRYCKIPRILRLYKTCYKIEDEEHFILECTINSKLRTDLFAILLTTQCGVIALFSSNFQNVHTFCPLFQILQEIDVKFKQQTCSACQDLPSLQL
jgi:hypothetical protein